MGKTILFTRLLLVLLVSCFLFCPSVVSAQVAPTTTATVSGSVVDSGGKPVANAKVTLAGPRTATTQTDAQGQFVFVGIVYGDYELSTAAIGLGTATRHIVVQGDTNIAITYEPVSRNGLKVIANVSSSANAAFNITPASVTQVNPIQNAFEGKTSWRTILEQIPGVSQAGYGNGDDYQGALPDGPLEPMMISINGALPYETATLVDEMPLIGGSGPAGVGSNSVAFGGATGSGTDLGLYPLNAFGSADVVRGPGANAPSIVDSIGGSFELHPNQPVSSNEYELSLSTDPYGGIVSNALAAVRWNKLSATITYGLNSSPGPLSGTSVPFSIFSVLYGSYAFPSTFYINGHTVTAPYGNFGQELYKPGYTNAPYGSGYGSTFGLMVGGVPQTTAWNQHSGSIALNYAISPSVTAGLFYAGQGSEQAGTPIFCTIDFTPPPGYMGSVPTGLALYPTNGYYGDYFQTQSSSLVEERVNAQIGQGTLHVAALQNRTNYGNPTIRCSSETSTVQLYGGAYLDGSSTPTVFNGGTYTVTGPYLCQGGLSVTNNRDMMVSYATPLGENLHVGASFVQSYYNNPNYSYEAFSGVGNPDCYIGTNQPNSLESETTREERVFIGGDPSRNTSLDLSMYFVSANYHVPNPNDPSGNTYTNADFTYAAPRLGFVWRPKASIAVRASAGGGFAEAPLSDLLGGNGTPQLNAPQNNAYYVNLNNINLQPEKSFAFDLGTDIRLQRGTILSFDVYRSNLYGQVYYSSQLIGTYLGLPLYSSQYGNLGESRYEGILIDLRHDANARGIYWTLSGGLTRAYVISVPNGFYDGITTSYPPPTYAPVSTACTNCQNLSVVPNINFNGTFDASIPYASGLGRLGYRWAPGKYVDLAATYYGNNNTYYRPAFVELDGEFSYPLTKKVSLLAIFRNITGIYDGGQLALTPGNISGAPTVAGPPNALYGEEYGPRIILVTTTIRM